MAINYRTAMVDTARKYLGTAEPSGDDQFIQAYNKSVGTTFNMATPWCAMFITYIARMCGVPTTVIPNFASCSVAVNTFFKPRGWFKDAKSGYIPQPGDLIFYDWDLDKNPNHVGMVASVSGGKVNTIEGNTSDPTKKNKYDGVYSKSYALSYKMILGYAVPPYGTAPTGIVKETQLSSLVKQTRIKEFQTWLNTTYSTGLAVDGAFGAQSKKAAIRGWQTEMNNLYNSKLAVDGAFGPVCRAAAAKKTLKLHSKNNLVYLLQGLLYAHGYDAKGFDGDFGSGSKAAVEAFQKARKLEQDGIVGPITWESLLMKW